MRDNNISRAATADELAKIKAAAATRPESLPAQTIANILNAPAMPVVPAGRVTVTAFKDCFATVNAAVMTMPDGPVKATSVMWLNYISPMDYINLDGFTATGAFDALIGAGLQVAIGGGHSAPLTREMVAAMTAKAKADSVGFLRPTIVGPSWAVAELGSGIRIEAADVVAARAL